MKQPTLIIALAVSCLLLCCKKKNNNTPSVTLNDSLAFTFTGTPCIGDTIYFSTNEPSQKSYQWNFGDGSTGTASTPFHQYADSGLYSVSLVVNNDTAHPISRDIFIYNDPVYTYLLAGSRTWHDINIAISDRGPDTTISTTSITITVLNKIAIVVFGDTLVYSPHHSSADTLMYTGNYQNSYSYGNSYLTFYRASGSLSYSLFNYPTVGLKYSEFIDFYTTL